MAERQEVKAEKYSPVGIEGEGVARAGCVGWLVRRHIRCDTAALLGWNRVDQQLHAKIQNCGRSRASGTNFPRASNAAARRTQNQYECRV
jgi:hypothetical protein